MSRNQHNSSGHHPKPIIYRTYVFQRLCISCFARINGNNAVKRPVLATKARKTEANHSHGVCSNAKPLGPHMAFTLYSLFKAALLMINALAVLHEKRFLAKSRFCRHVVVWSCLSGDFRTTVDWFLYRLFSQLAGLPIPWNKVEPQ